MNKPIHISDAEFQEKVLESDLPVLVDFWAPWCGPCRMIAPILENVAKEYKGRLIVTKVNTDEYPEWAMEFGVQGIPTLLFISGGEEIDRLVGAGPAPMINAMVDVFLSKVSLPLAEAGVDG
ncbi:MAG: thioredoxin [Chloroflexi bacterium RBG_19FT_COMBO_55_16]|nr:MAG: thioredoxin [Chloroflexi bacterium RBG_19FT_COMBO_55_16]